MRANGLTLHQIAASLGTDGISLVCAMAAIAAGPRSTQVRGEHILVAQDVPIG